MKWELLLKGTGPVCVASVYLMSQHLTKSPRPCPLYLHNANNQILEVEWLGNEAICQFFHIFSILKLYCLDVCTLLTAAAVC